MTIKLNGQAEALDPPRRPFLYDLSVELSDAGKVARFAVASYFGMRTIAVGKDDTGDQPADAQRQARSSRSARLDQGFWPDGLYTAPTDEALRYDIEVTKKLGFNMTRKHVKVEPDRWYYWCDKPGPPGLAGHALRRPRSIGPDNDPDGTRSVRIRPPV